MLIISKKDIFFIKNQKYSEAGRNKLKGVVNFVKIAVYPFPSIGNLRVLAQSVVSFSFTPNRVMEKMMEKVTRGK